MRVGPGDLLGKEGVVAATNLPAGVTASFSPATLTGAGTSTMTVTIPTLAAAKVPHLPGRHAPVETALAGLALVALLLGRKRRWLSSLALVALGVLSLTLTGCSNTGNGFAVPTTTGTITITGTSGTAAHSTTVTLTIQ